MPTDVSTFDLIILFLTALMKLVLIVAGVYHTWSEHKKVNAAVLGAVISAVKEGVVLTEDIAQELKLKGEAKRRNALSLAEHAVGKIPKRHARAAELALESQVASLRAAGRATPAAIRP